jgi:hypothetical protein
MAGITLFKRTQNYIVLANERVIDTETYMDAQMHVGITGDRIVTISETPAENKRK